MRVHSRHLSDHDLLMAIDRELSPRRQANVDAHVMACAGCHARRARLAATAEMATALCRDQTGDVALATHGRRNLLTAMRAASLSGQQTRPWESIFTGGRGWVMAAAVAAAVMLVIRVMPPAGRSAEHGALPVATLTPGATWNVTEDDLCAGGGRQQRPLPASVRKQVLRDYGMERVPADEYELDYLITPQLGGAPDAQNIWPQRYGSSLWNAYVKDQLEELLPRLVCEGQVPLRTAQRDIAADWIGAYQKYFNTELPLPRSRAAREDDGPITYPVWRAGNAPALQLISFAASR